MDLGVALLIGLGLLGLIGLGLAGLMRTIGKVKLLENAILIGSEIKLNTTKPFAVRGRVDQVWLVPNKGYILVDTKRRSAIRTYPGDKLQLSVYAWQLRRQERFRNKPVIDTAYIRIPVEDGPAHFAEIALYSDEATENYIHQAFALASRTPKSQARRCYRCRHCGHLNTCKPV